MIYNVAQLMKAQVGNTYSSAIHEEQVQLDSDLNVIGPIDGHVRMRRVNQGLLVDGWVDLTLGLTCTRCLKEFEQLMHVTFEERFYPTVDVVTGAPLPPIEEDDVFSIDEHHQVDLTEAIRQAVLLAVPMVTLCKEDCAGLCSQCGHDLNLGPCNCEPEGESQFNILKDLLPISQIQNNTPHE
ncbi:YceD family protein [Tengunoibacter tsumagoiensis]|uniref:DUF177 domain-containing protein n=1 Tax=Tengunoibacter tsumagoiensis TaxID=2014871 RepID=A0A402A4L1_9CHLR|nr:DUF177 domain-containing protein [Tengunoibacter tsumagoiensis]GCE13999.1 hypothetical protein KTT_38580 [Tengunoibacter tsumagoiensis]